MKHVVLFKSPSEEYRQAFNKHDLDVSFIEPLQFDSINLAELDAKLQQPSYAGLVLTSPRAIEAVSKCWDHSKYMIWHEKRVYTVGEASGHKIKLLLGLESLGLTAGNAENLAKIIINENSKSKFLFPCGNLSSEVLPDLLQASGNAVDTLTVYQTRENKNLKTDLMELCNSKKTLHCLVFFSPSGCEYVHRELQTFNNTLTSLPYFAIGHTTAHRIEMLGADIAGVADKPQPDSLVNSVMNYLDNLSTES